MRSGKVDLRNVNKSCIRAFFKPLDSHTCCRNTSTSIQAHIYICTPITVLASRGNILFRSFTGVIIHII